MSPDTSALVDKLREALSRRPDVDLAVLFGSRARGKARPDSDADLAVRGKGLDPFALARDLSLASGVEVHTVDLDAMTYPLLDAIVRDAVFVHQREPGTAGRWLSQALLELETDRPWYERMRNAYLRKLAEEVHGNANVITAKLRDLADSVAQVRKHRPADAAVLAQDRDVLDLVSFNLMLAVQACSDIASHLIADEGWPPAPTLAESFRQLQERGVLSEPVAAALGQAVGLRNQIAHGYSKADRDRIHWAAVHGLADLERFAAEVSAWVSRRLGL